MQCRTRQSHRAFTLLELLIVIAIISMLISIAAPAYNRAKEAANRTRCSKQQQQIIEACKLYAAHNRGRWPNAFTEESTRGDDLPLRPGEGGGLRGPDDDDGLFGSDEADRVVNSNTASLWILVAQDYAPAELFICPSTADVPDNIRNPEEVRDFLSRRHCSYSYQCGLGGRRIRESWRLAVLADRSPFFDPHDETDDPQANSFNHWSEGQMVAFADGHVDWFPRPYLRATGDWFYHPWPQVEEGERDVPPPDDIPEGDAVPQRDDDALLM